MSFLRSRTLRARLTVWYVSALCAILLVYAGAMSTVLFLQLRHQLDNHAIEQIETVEGYLHFLPNGRLNLRTDYHDHPYPSTEQQRYIEVRSLAGEILFKNEPLGDRVLDGSPQPGEGVTGYSPRSMRLPDGQRVRLISRRHPVNGTPVLIRLGLSEEPLWETFFDLIFALAAGAPFALLLAAWGGSALARNALRPIERMARRAREINAAQLNARLVVENPDDEVGQLATAFNETLARLEDSFVQLRRFTSDAAHELRTPLTAIQSVGEVGLRRNPDAAHYREVIESMLEEADRLRRLVEGLLQVARAESGQLRLERSGLPALQQVREVSALLEVLAEEKQQSVEVGGDDSVQAHADRAVFRQILINLLDNAIKYSPVGGRIAVNVARKENGVVAVTVADSGAGIPPEQRSRIFDRFYRVDEARSRESGGTGLGLAIAKWGAEAHGGSLEVAASSGRGSTFVLLIPEALPSKNSQREHAL